MPVGKVQYSAVDFAASELAGFDHRLVVPTSGRLAGWIRFKVKCNDLAKIAFEARSQSGQSIAFETICHKGQFRCYLYISDSIESLTLRIKYSSDVPPADIVVDLREISVVEYVWKSLGAGLLRKPLTYLSYFKAPLDPFIVTFLYPAPPPSDDPYRRWISDREPMVVADCLKAFDVKLSEIPEVTILTTVCDPHPSYLLAALESVRAQTSPKWRLSIADDASKNPEIRQILERAAASDDRISVSYRTQRGGISAATNEAFRSASSPLVTCLDHDDTLADVAVEASALHFAQHPGCGMLFSDEDKMDERGNRYLPYFKPRRFSPELFYSYNYINHLTVHRAETIRRVGGWRSEYDGAQDYDLSLRSLKLIGADAVHHLPLILYHWRAIAGSAALDVGYKPYAIEKGRLALEDYFSDQHLPPAITVASDTMYRVARALPDAPRVSVLIPFRDKPQLLRQCVSSLLGKTDYPNFEILLIDNGSVEPDTAALLDELAGHPSIRMLRDDRPFNYSRLNNAAAREATGDYLCLMNNDIEITEPEWLTDMMSYAAVEGIGCVGAKLYYPLGTIQHAGVILGMGGVAGHAFLNAQRNDPGYFGRLLIASNYSAVTGACLLVKRDTYLRVGGLDEEHLTIAFNDIDFCLKVQALGLRNVVTPFARLTHWESASRGAEDSPEKVRRFHAECRVMLDRHKDILFDDPFYSPHLSLHHGDFRIRVD